MMKTCPKCHHQNPVESNFCNNCGNNLSEETQDSSILSETIKKPIREAERRQLTILFCDLVGSTPLSQKLDPEDYRNMITNYHQVAEKVIKSYGGYVAQYLGDGLLVYFGYPEGLEDAPKLSIQAGLGILNAMKSSNKDSESKGFPPIQIRIGIHSGLVVVDDHLALGDTVNIAARLEGAAPPDGLVISLKTLELAQGWFNIESIGKIQLKGVEKPMEVFQVLSESGALTKLDIAKKRGLSPLVGRVSDLEKLEDQWEKSKKGNGQLVLIHGEAGIGKSRLVDTFKEQILSTPGSQLLIARSSAYQQNSAFYPIVGLLRSQVFNGFDKLTEEEQSQEVVNRIQELFPEDQKLTSLILEFLSLGNENYPPLMIAPMLKRQLLIDGITKLIMGIGKECPLCLIIEDLHWTDASTLVWLDLFIQAIENHTIYVICTTRPIDAPPWLKYNNVSVQYLDRLSVEEIKKICDHQTKGKNLPKEILHQITIKTEGVPLFVEELTKMILGSEFLKEEENGYEITGSIKDISIPSTLQDSLLARLDRLSNVKEIVQVGSVLGREFSFSMIDLLVPGTSDETKDALQKLVNEEIIYEKESEKDTVFQFKHALIQDAAYSSLLRSKRQKMHLHIAETLESHYDSLTRDQPQLLAFHYTEGAEYKKAVPLWLLAGQKFSQKNASMEAISHLENGISLLKYIEDIGLRNNYELDLQLTLGGMYVVSHGFPHPKVKETFNKAREVAQRTEISPKLALIMINLLSYYMNTEDYQSHGELSKHMEELTKDPQHGYWFKIFLCQLGGGGNIIRGNFVSANEAYSELLEIFDPSIPFSWELAPSGYLEIGAKAWQMIGLQIMGYTKKARKLAIDHLEYATDHHDSMTLYHIHTFPSLYNLEAREWQKAFDIIEDYIPVVKEFGDPVFILTAEVYYHIASAFIGNNESLQVAVNLMETCLQIGFRAFAVSLSSFISDLYLHYNKPDLALEWCDKILDHVNKTGTHIKTCELLRLKASALSKKEGTINEVEKILLKAISLAKEQSAKIFELRSSKDLAELWYQSGEKEKAENLLTPIYNWFEPDDKSVDLIEAKMWLEKIENENHDGD